METEGKGQKLKREEWNVKEKEESVSENEMIGLTTTMEKKDVERESDREMEEKEKKNGEWNMKERGKVFLTMKSLQSIQ